jgi:carboxyl-terminal processing protease
MSILKISTLAFILSLSSICTTSAQVPDSVKHFIDSTLSVMQRHSLYAKKVNWKKIRQATFTKANHAQTINDTYNALTWAFSQLKDYHGLIRIGNSVPFGLNNPVPDNRKDTNMLKVLFQSPPKIVITKIGNYGYIRVPHMPQLLEASINRAANGLKDSVCKLNSLGVAGWIIDLRVNVGGNFRQMLGGLGPILCSRQLGTFVDKNGNKLESWRIENGQMFVGNTQGAAVLNPCTVDCNLPVAVLIGPSTGSSGEITAISLSSRPNTRFFGERTAGYANSTQGFYVGSNNNIYILLTTALAVNNKGKLFNHFIDPDEVVNAKIDLNQISDDLINHALKWLEKYK